jgi:plastocyanin
MRTSTIRRAAVVASCIAVLCGAAACSSSTNDAGGSAGGPASATASDTPSETPSVSSSEATSAASGKTVEVTVTGSQVTPAPATVDLAVGETLTVVVTSDHADEVHAHGFEVEKEVEPNVPVTLELTGKEPGVYEIEMHDPALTLMQVAVK